MRLGWARGPSGEASIDLGSCPLGKYPWEVAALGFAFVRVPNIKLPILHLSGIINPKVYIVDIKFS